MTMQTTALAAQSAPAACATDEQPRSFLPLLGSPAFCWAALAAAIALEVSGTLALKALMSAGEGPALLSYAFLAGSYVLLSFAFRRIPVALAFAVWEGAGLLLLTLLSAALWGEHLSGVQWLGLGCLLCGVLLVERGMSGGATAAPQGAEA